MPAMAYNWQPTFDALNGVISQFIQRKQYGGMLRALSGGDPNASPASPSLTPGGLMPVPQSSMGPSTTPGGGDQPAVGPMTTPMGTVPSLTPLPAFPGGTGGMPAQGGQPPIPQPVGQSATPRPTSMINPGLIGLLSKMPAQMGMPLLMAALQKQATLTPKFSSTRTGAIFDENTGDIKSGPQPDWGEKTIAINPQTNQREYALFDRNSGRSMFSGMAAPDDIEFVNGQAMYKSGPNQGKPVEGTTQIGEAPLSPGRYQQEINKAITEKNAGITEVADPTSPTGTRLVRTGNAVGMPGATLSAAMKPREPQMVEFTDTDGERKQQMLQQFPNGQWATADQFRTPVNVGNDFTIMPAGQGGSRVKILAARMGGATENVAQGLSNIAGLPFTASMGAFGQAAQPSTFVGMLTRKITPQVAQSYQAMSAGLARGLASLEQPGYAPSAEFVRQLERLDIKEGDTGGTALTKLAEQRQAVESAIKGGMAAGLFTPAQRIEMNDLLDKVKSAIPYTVQDVNKIVYSKDKVGTFRDLAAKMGVTRPQTQPTPTQTAPVPSGRFHIIQVGQ